MDGVNTHHKDFDTFSPVWKRCRDVAAGQDAVHKAGEAYLPKLNDQEQDDYDAYRKRAGFFNATWRTIDGLKGMMFRKPPKIEVPASIESFLADIDMAGTSLETMAKAVAEDSLEVGRIGLLVDYPQRDNVEAISVAAAEQQGLRPRIVTYKAETIINWRYRRIANRWMLALVVLKEEVEEPDGEFKTNCVDQWRVLDLDEADHYRVRVFRKATGGGVNGEQFVQIGSDLYPTMNAKPLPFIPFAIVGIDGKDSACDWPPLIDLVDVNLSHYRTNADYEHGCHFTGLPTLFLAGFQNTDGSTPTFRIGSQAAVVSSDPQAQGKFIEFTGQGLDALKANLDRKEQQMALLGARMLFAEKKAVEAADTARIHRTGEASVLSAIAQAVSESLEWALGVFAQWAGATGAVTYQLNRDFNPMGLDAQQLTALLKAVQQGQISEQTLYELLQRADVADSERTWEAEQELIGQEAPPRPVAAPANDQTGAVA